MRRRTARSTLFPYTEVFGSVFFFFNDTATTEIYTLSLHDALPIWRWLPGQAIAAGAGVAVGDVAAGEALRRRERHLDRKSTRLNSSHANISYAVFCLKKKKL